MSPKVSVCVVTYNQEKYIEQCLESVLTQETDFNFEVIVGDDASTDKTKEIILSIQERYPEKLKVILHAKNIGAANNVFSTYRAATGKYIAHLDGDDFVLPGKIQKQADFMDENPQCEISFHRMKVLYEGVESKDDLVCFDEIPHGGYSRSDIIQLVTVGLHSSKMFINRPLLLPFVDFDIVDYFINIHQIKNGKADFVRSEPLGVYRAGIGMASAGLKTRRILAKCFSHTLDTLPQERRYVNAASLLLMLVDLKNQRETFFDFFKIWVRSFHPMSFLEVYRKRHIIRMLRLP